MNTFSVTVTYGNRFHLLKQVCESAFAEGVTKVIVVDNNSVPQSREKLKKFDLYRDIIRKEQSRFIEDITSIFGK